MTIKLEDCGQTIEVGPHQKRVRIIMVIKGPKGICTIYDDVWKEAHYNRTAEVKAIRKFMEFNNTAPMHPLGTTRIRNGVKETYVKAGKDILTHKVQ